MESASVVLASEKGRRSDSIFAWKTWENHGRKSPGFPKDFTAVGVHPNKGKPETDLFQLSEKHAGRKWKHKNIGRKLKFLGPTKNENQEFFSYQKRRQTHIDQQSPDFKENINHAQRMCPTLIRASSSLDAVSVRVGQIKTR
jgi:hypothetical protein